MVSLSLFAVERRKMVIACLGLTTVLALFGLGRLRLDDGYQSLFTSDTAEYFRYQELLEDFPSTENDTLILLEADNMLRRDHLSAVGRIHSGLKGCEGVTQVASLFSLRQRTRVGRYFLPSVRSDMSDDRLASAIQELKIHPLGKGHLISSDGSATLIVVRSTETYSSVTAIREQCKRFKEVVDREIAGLRIKRSITGLPMLRVEVIQSVQRDQVVVTSLALLVAGFIAWILFRRLAPILIVTLPFMLGTTWSVGLMGLVGEELNALNVVVPTLLMVIGFSDTVHLMFYFRGKLEQGIDPKSATLSTLKDIGPACVLTSITTAIGFGALVTVDDDLVQRFAATCACGALVMLAAVLLMFPLLSNSSLGLGCHPSNQRMSGTNRFCIGLADWVTRRHGFVATLAVIATIVCVIVSLGIQPDFRYTENLARDNPAYETTRRCDDVFQGSSLIHVVVQPPPGYSLRDGRIFHILKSIHAAIETQPAVAAPVSIMNLVDSMPGTSRADQLAELRFVPADVFAVFFNRAKGKLAVRARVQDVGSTELISQLAVLKESLAQIVAQHPGSDIHLTGLPVLSSYRAQRMILDLAKSVLTASVLIFLVMAFALRSIRLGIAGIIPNVFPVVATAATYVVAGQPLRYSGVICFCVCLGIAVDDTIHFLSRFQLERKKHIETKAAIQATVVAITPVLTCTTSLLMAGFGVAMVSTMPPLRLFGLTSCVALSLALLADLIFLPSILTVLDSRDH